MGIRELGNKILELLADNAQNNISPPLMDSDILAKSLNISLPETRQALNALEASGLIVASLEGQYSLITHEGMRWVDQHSLRFPLPCQA